MGGIDEAALDRLSLVTEMTKHIRVRATGGITSASELGQFAPVFIWLLRVWLRNYKNATSCF
jgi:Guanylate-binding protein, N-terminal domain